MQRKRRRGNQLQPIDWHGDRCLLTCDVPFVTWLQKDKSFVTRGGDIFSPVCAPYSAPGILGRDGQLIALLARDDDVRKAGHRQRLQPYSRVINRYTQCSHAVSAMGMLLCTLKDTVG